MNILISGASGLVGTESRDQLQRAGHEVFPLNRGQSEGIHWDVATGRIDLGALAPDAVIHLAGEPIASRWTKEKKRAIWSSRVDATRKMCEFLAQLPTPPKVFLGASAIGYYGSRGDDWIDEASPPCGDFLCRLCVEWEAAAEPLTRAGCRVVHFRTGIVLSPKGGALRKMLPFFRLGLGGPAGDGQHWMSWIALEDEARAIHFLLENDSARGAFNLVSENPVRNAEFAAALGAALRKPARFRVPAFLLRVIYGEFVDAALLASQRIKPTALRRLGFEWTQPDLNKALSGLRNGRDQF